MKNLTSLYVEDVEIIIETVQRLVNDFEALGISVRFSGNVKIAYQELMGQLTPALRQLLKINKPKLMEVLRRIDISEGKLSEPSGNTLIKNLLKLYPV